MCSPCHTRNSSSMLVTNDREVQAYFEDTRVPSEKNKLGVLPGIGIKNLAHPASAIFLNNCPLVLQVDNDKGL